MPIKTSSGKAKGRKLQQHTAKAIAEALDLSPDDIVSRSMGSAGTDLLMSPKAQETFPVSVECKNTKKFPSLAALEQSRANHYKDTIPAVVWKPFNKGMDKSIIYFDLNEFIEWWQENGRF